MHPCMNGLPLGCNNGTSFVYLLVSYFGTYVRPCNESLILCLVYFGKFQKGTFLVPFNHSQLLLVSYG
jgi:hypothetical protein